MMKAAPVSEDLPDGWYAIKLSSTTPRPLLAQWRNGEWQNVHGISWRALNESSLKFHEVQRLTP